MQSGTVQPWTKQDKQRCYNTQPLQDCKQQTKSLSYGSVGKRGQKQFPD